MNGIPSNATIVLVRGAWAAASSWSPVIQNDPFFMVPEAQAFLRALPQAELHLIGGGHFLLEKAQRIRRRQDHCLAGEGTENGGCKMTTSKVNTVPGSALQPEARVLRVSDAILYATLVVGVLDATDGILFFATQGKNPIQVLQYIASSLLGVRSFSDGLASAGLGLVLHFAVSLVVAAIYILASWRISVLRTQWMPLGLLYGIAVWSVMNLVLLPHTAVVGSALTAAALANGIIGHALFVGLPSAFVAQKVPPEA